MFLLLDWYNSIGGVDGDVYLVTPFDALFFVLVWVGETSYRTVDDWLAQVSHLDPHLHQRIKLLLEAQPLDLICSIKRIIIIIMESCMEC